MAVILASLDLVSEALKTYLQCTFPIQGKQTQDTVWMGIPTIPFQVTPYLSLPLPLQVHNAHVHNGSQIGKGFHGHYVGALFIAVNIELKKKEQF